MAFLHTYKRSSGHTEEEYKLLVKNQKAKAILQAFFFASYYFKFKNNNHIK